MVTVTYQVTKLTSWYHKMCWQNQRLLQPHNKGWLHGPHTTFGLKMLYGQYRLLPLRRYNVIHVLLSIFISIGDNIHDIPFDSHNWNYVLKYGKTYTISIFHLDVLTSQPYHAQIQLHTSRILDNFRASLTCKRCKNGPNWECHVSLDPVQF